MPFKSNVPEVIRQIKKDIVDDVQQAGEKGFQASQRQVKVVTGHLRDSGRYAVFDENGMLLTGSSDVPSPGATGSIQTVLYYGAEYASAVASRNHSESDHFMYNGFDESNDELVRGLSQTKS